MPLEKDRLQVLEGKIETGLQTWAQITAEVGEALAEIRTRKLYRETDETWEGYCLRRWEKTRQGIEAIESAGKIVKALPPATAAKVTSVNAAKALSKVPPPKRAKVVEAAAKTGKVTEKTIKAAAVKTLSPPPAKGAGPKDGTGLRIPSQLNDIWDRMTNEASNLLGFASSLRSSLRKSEEAKDVGYSEINFSMTLASVDGIYNDLKCAKPYAVCPTCQGKVFEGCTFCKGRGFVSEYVWKTIVTEEDKALRKKVVERQK